MYYGKVKQQLRFKKLLQRLENGEELTKEQINFIEERLRETKDRKLWLGVNLRKNGLQKLQTIVGENEEKKMEQKDTILEEKAS